MSRAVVSVVLASLAVAPAVEAQEGASPRTLFEAGAYQQVVDTVKAQGDDASPPDLLLLGQSLVRLDHRDEARDIYHRIDTGDEENAWTFIARSALAVLDGNNDAALAAAQRAATLAPDSFHANYELGIVQSLRQDFNAAVASLERATQIDPSDAYAHYYAGLAFNKVRRVDQMAKHFQTFVRLAPKAPERPQVETILRTLRF